MPKPKYPCSCPRCKGAHVSDRTLRRHRKNNLTPAVPSIVDWMRRQGRPQRQLEENLGGDEEGDEEGNGGALSECESEEGENGLGNRRAQKRRHIYQVCDMVLIKFMILISFFLE
jgi:hypothetical protein